MPRRVLPTTSHAKHSLHNQDQVRRGVVGATLREGSRVGFSAWRADRAPVRLRPRLGRHRRTESGAVALEFALVVPIFLLLVLGTIQFGIYFWAAQGGSTAAREAARRAAVGDFPTCSAFR